MTLNNYKNITDYRLQNDYYLKLFPSAWAYIKGASREIV